MLIYSVCPGVGYYYFNKSRFVSVAFKYFAQEDDLEGGKHFA